MIIRCSQFFLITKLLTRTFSFRMAHGKRIPDRWEDYTRLGNQVKGTRFITFKVPLKEDLCRRLPEELRFTPSDLIQEIQDRGVKLGLVIDLTNTTRYYDPEVFLDAEIEYRKIFIPGRVVPAPDLKMDFLSTVDDFIDRHPEEDVLVGVHCTHGLNRTGHLVCRYMIDRLNMEPDTAVQLYNEARGHDMEREAYIEDLRTCPTDMAQYEVYRKEQAAKAKQFEESSSNISQNNAWSDSRQHVSHEGPGVLSEHFSHDSRGQFGSNFTRDQKGPGSGWSLENDDHKNGRYISNDRRFNHGGQESVWSLEHDRRHSGRGFSNDRQVPDKGPGSGWSLDSDGHQSGRGLSYGRQIQHAGPGSGWSLDSDGQKSGRGLSHGRQVQRAGPGSGWSLGDDNGNGHREHASNFSNNHQGRNLRGKGSGWSLPDDGQVGYGGESRQYGHSRERSRSPHDGGQSRNKEDFQGGYSQGRFRGRNSGDLSVRGRPRSRYYGDHEGRSRPYGSERHHSTRGSEEAT